MNKHIYIREGLVALFQLIIFGLTYEIIWRIYTSVQPNYNSDISWGLTVRFALIIMSILITLSFLVKVIFNKTKSNILFFIFPTIVFSAFFIQDISYTPYKTSLLIFCGAVSFVMPLFTKKLQYFNQN